MFCNNIKVLYNTFTRHKKIIKYIEEVNRSVFVCEICYQKEGKWVNNTSLLFYKPDEDEYFFCYSPNSINHDAEYMRGLEFLAIKNIATKKIFYSTHRHGFIRADDEESFIDGGLEYTRVSTGPSCVLTKLKISDGKLKEIENEL